MVEHRLDGRLLVEYVALEYILLGDIRDVLEEPADEQSRRWLTAILDTLLDTLPREYDLKCRDGGYLAEVLEQYPNWYTEIDRLDEERTSLFGRLAVLRDALYETDAYLRESARVRRDLQEWMQRFVAHHRHERRLVMNAYTIDVGAGD